MSLSQDKTPMILGCSSGATRINLINVCQDAKIKQVLDLRQNLVISVDRRNKMFGMGLPEMIIVLIIALVFFGPSKLPSLGKSLGEAIRGFKKAVAEDPADDKAKIEK